MDLNFENKLKHLPYHDKVGPCYTRPAYRDGKRKTAVKVFTIADESCYLLLFGVPSLGLEQPLKERCKHYGNVESLVKLIDYPDKDMFTDVFLVKYKSVQTARFAKRSLDDSSFYGGFLHVCYAPEFETIADCRLKLYECRRLNARISRKAEHDYREKFTRTCESSTSEPVPAIPSTSNQAIPQSLDVCPREFVECQSLPMNTDTISSCTPFLSHDNPTMHQINETVSYPPCDALDDSRLYWKQFGTQLPDQNQLKVNPTGNSNMSPAIITHNISHPSASNHHHPQSGDLSTAQKRPIPLPVLQALSCRPYLETTSKADKPLPTAVTSETSQQVVQYSVSSFVPRILNDTIRMRNIHTKNPKASLPASGSSTPISVGELKRLAHSLGPEQGPSLPPPPKQKKVHDDGVNNTKRIVFHRTKLKQKDGYTPTCEEN